MADSSLHHSNLHWINCVVSVEKDSGVDGAQCGSAWQSARPMVAWMVTSACSITRRVKRLNARQLRRRRPALALPPAAAPAASPAATTAPTTAPTAATTTAAATAAAAATAPTAAAAAAAAPPACLVLVRALWRVLEAVICARRTRLEETSTQAR
jgi:hypothetical protein